MARFSASVAKAAPAAAAAIIVIRPPSGRKISVLEIGIANTTAVASSIAMGRVGGTAGTQSAQSLVQAEENIGDTGVTNIETAWSAAPTNPTVRNRGIVLPATIGAGWVWSWAPGQLYVGNGANSAWMLYNFGGAAAAALEVYVVVDE